MGKCLVVLLDMKRGCKMRLDYNFSTEFPPVLFTFSSVPGKRKAGMIIIFFLLFFGHKYSNME